MSCLTLLNVTIGTVMIGNREYQGELDPENNACGEGILKALSGDLYEGTFYNSKFHGFGKFSY